MMSDPMIKLKAVFTGRAVEAAHPALPELMEDIHAEKIVEALTEYDWSTGVWVELSEIAQTATANSGDDISVTPADVYQVVRRLEKHGYGIVADLDTPTVGMYTLHLYA